MVKEGLFIGINMELLINCCPAEPGFILFWKHSTVDQDQLTSDESIWSGSKLLFTGLEKFKMHAYNWNAGSKRDKNWGGVVHNMFSMTSVNSLPTSVICW